MKRRAELKNRVFIMLVIVLFMQSVVPASAVQLSDVQESEAEDFVEIGSTQEMAMEEEEIQVALAEDGTEIPLTYHTIDGEDEVGSILDDPAYDGPVYASMQRKYDPLENGGLPAIRNQSPYGTCWAFSSVGMGETGWYVKNGESIDLSALHLAYFSYHSVADPLGGLEGDTNTCIGADFLDRGGNLALSGKVLANWTGAAAEKTAPYGTAAGIRDSGLDFAVAYEDELHLQGAYSIRIKDEPEVAKQMIKEYGGIGVSYYSEPYPYQTYYNSTYHSYYVPENKNTNHAVMIVGWDNDFPKENFNNEPEGDGAWLIRNSWGGKETYSYYSYFWISYYDKSLYSVAYAFEYEPADNYDNNYQYDGAMQDRGVGLRGQIKAANVYTAKANPRGMEILRAVSFHTYNGLNLNYKIEIYTNLADASNPESGILAAEAVTTGKTTLAGYYTVPLEEDVALEEGTTFSVVVTLAREDGETVYIAVESPITASWYATTTKAEAGQSFLKSGLSWKDYGAGNNRNIRIKAFTDSYTAQRPVTAMTFSDETKELNRGESYEAKVNMEPLDTDSIPIWSSSDRAVATVDSRGVITGVGAGTADIIVSADGVRAVCTVTVKVPITEVSIAQSDREIFKGQSFSLTATSSPADTTSVISWKSSDTSVVTVSEAGMVKGVGSGTAYITAYADGVSAVCTVRVKEAPEGIFVDVKKKDWFYDAVNYMYVNGIMSGVGKGRFAPNDTTNRAMVVQILYSSVGKPPVSGSSRFEDVAWGKWYTNAVTWAVQNRVTSGVSSTRFAPEQEVSRQEVAMFLYKQAQLRGYDTTGRNDLNSFKDSNLVSGWALEAMQWANHEGIINGKSGRKLDPQGPATRAEIAVMMRGFMERYQ